MKTSKYIVPTNIVRILDNNAGYIARDLQNAIIAIYGIKPGLLINSESYDLIIDKINKPVLNDVQNFVKGYLWGKAKYQFLAE
jgi:hypothetical protein